MSQWPNCDFSHVTKCDPAGGFQGNHGEFYGDDEDNGHPIKVRYTWDKLDHDHARWKQAFSYDNRTWETNWIGER